MTNQEIFEMTLNTLQACSNARAAYTKAAGYDPARHQMSFGCEKGSKFVKLFSSDGSGRSAIGFIEIATGNLYKAASWKAPAKNFPRGNALRGDFRCCGPFSIG